MADATPSGGTVEIDTAPPAPKKIKVNKTEKELTYPGELFEGQVAEYLDNGTWKVTYE